MVSFSDGFGDTEKKQGKPDLVTLLADFYQQVADHDKVPLHPKNYSKHLSLHGHSDITESVISPRYSAKNCPITPFTIIQKFA